MPTTGLEGPFALTADNIDRVVMRTSAGAYALGEMGANNVYLISRIGRSDLDLRRRLKDYLGKYPLFKAGYEASPKAAFEKECHLYHDFSPPDNAMHPDRPSGSNWTCPRCLIFHGVRF